MKAAVVLSLIGGAFAQKGYRAPAPTSFAGKGYARPAPQYTAPAQYSAPPPAPRQTSTPVYSCPAGYTLEGKTCERTQTAAPQIQCTVGQLQGDQCVSYVPQQARCPPGTQQGPQGCYTTSSVPANEFCPPGYTDTGNGCEMTQQLPTAEFCDIGTREGNQCVTSESAPFITNSYCPPGYEEHAKGGCWRTEVYDCTPPYHGKDGMRGLAGKGYQAPAPVAPPAQTKVNVIAQTCERKESAPKIQERHCPPGYTESGKQCTMRNYYPTTTRCSNGRSVAECYATQNAPKQRECPPGTTPVGGICQTTQTAPMEHYCPPGTQDVGGQCATYTPPQQFCPPGYTQSGGICTARDTTPPQVTVTVTCTGKGCYNH